MAQIVLKMKANDGYDQFIGFTANKPTNNVSTLINETTTRNNGVNGKSLATGFLSLKDGYLGGQDSNLQSEIDKYNGFMFGATDNNGNYQIELSLQGKYFDRITIIGDKNANQFPIEAVLDEGTEQEKIVFSDDAIWDIAFMQVADIHTIKFTKWNRANYNACFILIKVLDEYITFDKTFIKNISNIRETALSNTEIGNPIISKSGTISITDIDKELQDYIQDGIIKPSNVEFKLTLNDNIFDTQITNDTKYDINDLTASFQMGDSLNRLDTKYLEYRVVGGNIQKGFYDTNTTAYNVLRTILDYFCGYDRDEIVNSLKEKIQIWDSESNSVLFLGTIADYLSKIQIKSLCFKNQMAKKWIEKFCKIFLLTLTEDENGKLKFYPAIPQSLGEIIKINNYNIISSPQTDILPNNSISAVNIQKKEIIKTQFFAQTESKSLDKIIEKESEDFLFITPDITSLFANYTDDDTIFEDENVTWSFFKIEGNKAIIGRYTQNSVKNNKFDYIPMLKGSQLVGTPFCIANFTYPSGTTVNEKVKYLGYNYDYNSFLEYIKTNFDGTTIVASSKWMSENVTNEWFFAFIFQGFAEITPKITNAKIYYGLKDSYGLTINDSDKKSVYISQYNDNEFEISDNEFAIDGITWDGNRKMYDIISDNILYYCDKPRQSIEANLFCTDYYNIDNELAINYKYGETLNCKNLIMFDNDKDDNIYSIYHRELKFDGGAPIINIKALKVAENTLRISYNLDGGVLQKENPTIITQKDLPYTLNNPTKTGYSFAGWSEKGFVPRIEFTIPRGTYGTKKYEANFELIQYDINYGLIRNSGSEESLWNEVPIEGFKLSYNVTETFALKTPSIKNYQFLGWTGMGIDTPDTVVTIPKGSTGTRKYIANFIGDEYKLYFDYDGGTQVIIPVVYPDEEKVNYGKYVKMSVPQFTKIIEGVTYYSYKWQIDGKDVPDGFWWNYTENKTAKLIYGSQSIQL